MVIQQAAVITSLASKPALQYYRYSTIISAEIVQGILTRRDNLIILSDFGQVMAIQQARYNLIVGGEAGQQMSAGSNNVLWDSRQVSVIHPDPTIPLLAIMPICCHSQISYNSMAIRI